MRLNKEDYKRAEGYLKRYDYNSATILFKRDDIFGISATRYTDMPKAPYRTSDSVADAIINLEEDKEYQKAVKEYKIIELAKTTVHKDCLVIFEELYRKKYGKYKIMYENGYSEATYKRRKQELIYAVNDIIKKDEPKLSQN